MAAFNDLGEAGASRETDQVAIVRGAATLRQSVAAILAGIAEATAIARGTVRLANAAPLKPIDGGSAGGDNSVSRRDHRHPLPGGDQIEAALDAHFGNAVWRSAHTELRTAAQVRDLLATVLGPNWWQGAGGSGITLDQAIDGVGAALAMLPQVTYDAAANAFAFRLPNDSVLAEQIRAGDAAEKLGWREKIDFRAGLPPFLAITPIPAGIPGSDFPEHVDIVFAEKLTAKTITGVTLTMQGVNGALDPATPVSGLDAPTELHGLLRFNFGAGERGSLKTAIARDGGLRYLGCGLTITFSDGTDNVHNFAWPVNNAAFAAPPKPQAVFTETTAAIAVNAAPEVTLATAAITPRSSASRIRVDGQCVATADAPQGQEQDLRMKLRLYRGNALLSEIEQGNPHADRRDDERHAMTVFALDSPNATDEQAYTLRALRQGDARPWSITQRRLLLAESL